MTKVDNCDITEALANPLQLKIKLKNEFKLEVTKGEQ